MSNVHVILDEDTSGDLVDIEYFHHACAPVGAKEWPAPESIDYPVYCGECGDRVEEVGLTDDGIAYAHERGIDIGDGWTPPPDQRYFAWDDDVIIPFTLNADGQRVVTADSAITMIRSIIWTYDHPEVSGGWTPEGVIGDILSLLANAGATPNLAGPKDYTFITLPDYGIPECREDGTDL